MNVEFYLNESILLRTSNTRFQFIKKVRKDVALSLATLDGRALAIEGEVWTNTPRASSATSL